MINPQKKGQEKSCNCKNSKCMKLYCECFSARVACGRSCHCVGCQNSSVRDLYRQSFLAERKISREQLIRTHKGCACRKSGCTKKYCECFQSGLLCKDTCKCIDCQNNESLTNRKVINQLRKNNSDLSNADNSINPLYLSQNSDHLNSIIAESNPLSLHENWLENCARLLYESGRAGDPSVVMDKLIQILSELEQNITEQQLVFQEQDLSDELNAGSHTIKIGLPTKKIKQQPNPDANFPLRKQEPHQNEEQPNYLQYKRNQINTILQNPVIQSNLKQKIQQQQQQNNNQNEDEDEGLDQNISKDFEQEKK